MGYFSPLLSSRRCSSRFCSFALAARETHLLAWSSLFSCFAYIFACFLSSPPLPSFLSSSSLLLVFFLLSIYLCSLSPPGPYETRVAFFSDLFCVEIGMLILIGQGHSKRMSAIFKPPGPLQTSVLTYVCVRKEFCDF